MTDHYTFPELPLAPVEAGTNLLVAGAIHSGVREFVYRMVASGGHDEGKILVTTDRNGGEALEGYVDCGGDRNPDRLGVVDCSEGGESDDLVRRVENPAELTGIGIEFSSLYQHLYDCGARRVRTGVVTLSPLVVYAEDIRPVYRFLHTLNGRVRTADGLNACVVDPTAVDDRTLSSIQQAFDGRIDFRAGDSGPQFRTKGIGGSDGWQSATTG